MGRNLTMRELRARKRRLVAESDIYRQTLRLEVHNLRVYQAGVRRKLSYFRALSPVLMMAAGLLRAPLGRRGVQRRPRSWLRLATRSLMSMRMYRQVLPLLQPLLAGFLVQKRSRAAAAEAQAPAANI